jgi:hypothetical protein
VGEELLFDRGGAPLQGGVTHGAVQVNRGFSHPLEAVEIE